MKRKILLRLNLLIFMLAFTAGLIFFACGFTAKLPKNVTIDGVDVGGMTRNQAASAVRERIEEGLKQKKLTVRGKKRSYAFTYPEIGYKDNIQTLINRAQKDGAYYSSVSYYLNGITEISSYIGADESFPAVEPHAIFNTRGEPFTYVTGADGAAADRLKLIWDINQSLNGGFEDVSVNIVAVKCKKTIDDVKNETRTISSFTTYFDGGNADRAYNIYLAAEKINGTVLNDGDAFSFNKTVGERTAERGFKAAKIIENGEFVEGIGGGVCQVSTTLFNTALLSGCKITEFHPHSLAVSYVPPSYDAMVSGNYYDLKFENVTGSVLYIRAYTGANYVKFCIYGKGNGAQYSYMSRVTGSVAAPEESTDDPALAREGKDGTISEGFLSVTMGGVSKMYLFRRDKYAPVKKIVYNGQLPEAEQITPQH